jgi:hypothetical protein
VSEVLVRPFGLLAETARTMCKPQRAGDADTG